MPPQEATFTPADLTAPKSAKTTALDGKQPSSVFHGYEHEDLKQKALMIRKAIRDEERVVIAKYPWLKHQDAIGLTIFTGSVAVSVLTAYFYWHGYISAVPTVCLIGFFVGLLHELEHDLIHDMYFKNSVLMMDIMFFVIWVMKAGVNPWYRRVIHLKHHQRSGQPDDIEERAIGLGLPFSWVRIAISINPFGALLVTRDIKRDAPEFSLVELLTSSALVSGPTFVLIAIWYLQMAGLFEAVVSMDPYVNELFWKINVVYTIPNIVRQGSLVLMSSYVHYYEDLPEGGEGLFFQNQILDTPWLWPLQFFCFNFGATHIIHHYVMLQPFYVRQMIATEVTKKMVSLGVRRNDYNIVARANRFEKTYPSTGLPGLLARAFKA